MLRCRERQVQKDRSICLSLLTYLVTHGIGSSGTSEEVMGWIAANLVHDSVWMDRKACRTAKGVGTDKDLERPIIGWISGSQKPIQRATRFLERTEYHESRNLLDVNIVPCSTKSSH